MQPFPLLILAFSALAAADEVKTELPESNRSVQRFVCNTGYKGPECSQQLAVLRTALAPYPTDKLGQWTWVLVKTDDWKPILQRLGGNPDSPAFSVLERHETFVEEALFAPLPSRRAELLRVWSLPLDQLRTLAITHELGHGICMDTNEVRADRFGRMLREAKNPKCDIASHDRSKRGQDRLLYRQPTFPIPTPWLSASPPALSPPRRKIMPFL